VEGLDCFPTTLAELVYAPLSTPASDKVGHGGWSPLLLKRGLADNPFGDSHGPSAGSKIPISSSTRDCQVRYNGLLSTANITTARSLQDLCLVRLTLCGLCNLAECWDFGLVTVGIETGMVVLL
jgi:hypothetical protein